MRYAEYFGKTSKIYYLLKLLYKILLQFYPHKQKIV